MNLLFVCTENCLRSPTAENVFSHRDGIEARSAGTSLNAKTRVSRDLLDWADKVFVMEREHADEVAVLVPEFDRTKLIVLDIPDDFDFMQQELIDLLNVKLGPLV